MKNTLIIAIVVLIQSIALCEVRSDIVIEKNRKNIVVLLDLSDRVLTKGQIDNDKNAIKLIVDQFWSQIKLMPIARYDALKIVIAPQNNISYEIEDLKNVLSIDLSNLELQDKKPSTLKSILYDELLKGVNTLYIRSRMSNKSSDYKGAQLWRYMKDYYNDIAFCEEGYSCRNYLIVITDGYLDFEDYSNQRNESKKTTSTRFIQKNLVKLDSQWEREYENNNYGILELGYHIDNLEVLVIGVNPKDQKYQFDILKRVWKDWMAGIGSSQTKLLLTDQIVNLESELKRFLK